LNNNIEIEIKLITSSGKVPSKTHASDIGYDISSSENTTLKSNEVTLVSTGIAINLPQQCAGLVLPRSGLSTKHKITLINSPGLIDPGYVGELLVPLINYADKDYDIKTGDRIAQLVLINTESVNFKIVDSLPDTSRSSGGFGSTD
tara:strand:+ start:36 stop:473 length:438 start_codon:yes stop_codon:yes gene_type:complete